MDILIARIPVLGIVTACFHREDTEWTAIGEWVIDLIWKTVINSRFSTESACISWATWSMPTNIFKKWKFESIIIKKY